MGTTGANAGMFLHYEVEGNIQMLRDIYLTCGELVMQGFSVGHICEDSRHGDLLLHSLQLQAQHVSVYGLSTDCLVTHNLFTRQSSMELLSV